MQARLAGTLIALSACLGAGVPAWVDSSRMGASRSGTVEPRGASIGERWAADWLPSLDAALATGRTVLAYARLDAPECVELERRLGADALVRERLAEVALVAVDVSRSDALGLAAAPAFLIVGTDGEVVDALVPTTGARFEPRGFADEIASVLAGRPGLAELRSGSDPIALADRLEAAGRFHGAEAVWRDAVASEGRPGGRFHRERRLRAALLAQFLGPEEEGLEEEAHGEAGGAADAEDAVEAQLTVEDTDEILFRGWSYLGSVFEDYVRRCEDGSFRGVPLERWERRLRDATRRGWRGVPEDGLDAYGALLTQRYARSPGDLDSADRMFCRAVLRTVAKRDGPRVPETREHLARIERR